MPWQRMSPSCRQLCRGHAGTNEFLPALSPGKARRRVLLAEPRCCHRHPEHPLQHPAAAAGAKGTSPDVCPVRWHQACTANRDTAVSLTGRHPEKEEMVGCCRGLGMRWCLCSVLLVQRFVEGLDAFPNFLYFSERFEGGQVGTDSTQQ